MVISASSDRKEVVIFVDFNFQRVIAVNQGRGALTYKIGDPIVAGPTSAEYSDVIHENVTNRAIPESPDGTIQPYSWLITEVDVRIKNESKKALTSVATVLKNEGKVVRYNEFGALGLVGDIRYEMPFRAHITYYQWFGNLALNGTAAQFGVDWNGAVNLTAGLPYTANGSENSTPFSGDRTYSEPTSPTKVNGAASDLKAIVLTNDTGGGYTYYQLRDLGCKLGFNVSWSAERGVYIESDQRCSCVF